MLFEAAEMGHFSSLAESCLADFAVASAGQTAYGLTSRRTVTGTAQVAQWFRLHTCNARGTGSNPDQGNKDPTCHAVWLNK